MNKLETQMIEAIRRGEDFKSNNTTVDWENGTATVRLHGNKICVVDRHGNLYVTWAGWETRTTTSRLTALLSLIHPHMRASIAKGKCRIIDSGGEEADDLPSDAWIKVDKQQQILYV